MSEEEILIQARNIKEYCIDHTTNEEQCPFYNGYKTEGMLQTVICELNKGMCSPCNWDVQNGDKKVGNRNPDLILLFFLRIRIFDKVWKQRSFLF